MDIFRVKNQNRIKEELPSILFYLGILLELLYVIVDKSEIVIGSEGILFRITFVVFLVKVLCTKYSKKEWLWIVLLGLVGVISYRCSSRNDVLRLVVMCAAFKGMDYKKVLKFSWCVTTAGILTLVVLSLLGILGEVTNTAVYRVEEETRYVLGLGHPNQLHCMFWVIVSLGMFLWFDALNILWIIGLMALNVGLFLLSDSKGGLLGVTVACILSVLLLYCKRIRDQKWPYVMAIMGIVLMAAFSIGLAYYGMIYQLNGKWEEPHQVWLYPLDIKLFTGRMISAYGYMDSEIRNFRLFSRPENTRYMDMGFYKLFYWYGYIPGAMYVIASCMLVWYAWKKKWYGLFMFVVDWSIYNFLEAHQISDYLGRNYLFFIMGGLWPELLRAQEEQEIYCWEWLKVWQSN